MISIIKDNARPRRKAFSVIKRYLQEHPPTAQNRDLPNEITEERKRKIRREILAEVKKDQRKNQLALLLTIVILLVLLFSGLFFFNFLTNHQYQY